MRESTAEVIDLDDHREHREHPGRACFEDVKALFEWLEQIPPDAGQRL